MLASAFHEYGFHVVPLEETFFISILQGPTIIDERDRCEGRVSKFTQFHE